MMITYHDGLRNDVAENARTAQFSGTPSELHTLCGAPRLMLTINDFFRLIISAIPSLASFPPIVDVSLHLSKFRQIYMMNIHKNFIN
jgi:hypothetical protein